VIVVVAIYFRDNLPHVFGPFETEDAAKNWIEKEKEQQDCDWNYSITEVVNIEETN
jgi:hypothetical protein